MVHLPGKPNTADNFAWHSVSNIESTAPEQRITEGHDRFVTTNAVPKSVALNYIINTTKSDGGLMVEGNAVIIGH